MIAVFVLLALVLGIALYLYTPDKARAAMEAQYATAPSTFITIDGVRLHVRDSGPRAAPALLMLHGFGSSLQTWDAWAARLSSSYRVIRFDLPGFGLTGPDPTGNYSDARAVALLAGLMDQLGVARASLIGNSLGGRIAWTFAAAHPQRVDRLVLVSPDGFASPGFDYNKKPDVPWILRVLPYVLPKPMLRLNLQAAYANPRALTEALFTRYYDMMRAPGVRRALIARMSQVMLQDPMPLLRRITAPTLLVWGEQDAMIPHTNAADYQRGISDCRLVSLPNVGHVPQEEVPTASLAPVSDFLK
jgi:pimeloyl-ACP methyl ester carboxylesterase